MKKQKKNIAPPWVVNIECLIKWVQKGMPVFYKFEQWSLHTTKIGDGMCYIQRHAGNEFDGIIEFKCVDVDDITLLIG